MTLVMEISKIIAQSASELFVWLEETYNINIDETAAKWSELTGMNITIRDGSEPELKNAKVVKNKVKKIPKIKDTKDLDVHLCQHMFQIGAKAGEQCSKKPKYGSFCTAHTKKVKTSVKSGKEEPKKKKEKKVVEHDEIDSNFESADDKKKKSKPKASKKKSPSKESKSEKSDSEEEVPLKLKKLKTGVDPVTGKKTTISSSEETDDEPTVKPTPLLNKKNKSKKPSVFDTDDEKIDANLDLSEDEE
jgi:hypothetical protein